MKHTIFFILMTFMSFKAFSQTVSQAKNNKVLLELGTMQTVPGDDIFCLDAAGKKKGLVQTSQVKGNRAVAVITKGTCEVGMTVRLRMKGPGENAQQPPAAAPAPTADQAVQQEAPAPTKARKKMSRTGQAWGIMGGLHMDSSTASFAGSSYSVSMSGMGFSGAGLYDYTLTRSWQFRALAGIETFNTSGTATGTACNNGTSTDCNFNLMNLAFQGIGKYNFNPGSQYMFWGGAHLGYIFALSKSSNAVNTSDLSTNWLYGADLGLDYALTKTTYIPVSIEYSKYPDSATVSASYIALRAGWATSF